MNEEHRTKRVYFLCEATRKYKINYDNSSSCGAINATFDNRFGRILINHFHEHNNIYNNFWIVISTILVKQNHINYHNSSNVRRIAIIMRFRQNALHERSPTKNILKKMYFCIYDNS